MDKRKTRTAKLPAIALAAAALFMASPASAEVLLRPDAIDLAPLLRQNASPDAPVRIDPESIRRAAASIDRHVVVASATQSQAGRGSSVGRKILGAALLGVGGFFAGGYLGAKIDGDCGGCDDPGFKGALIGAPIGAVVGAIVGAKIF